MFTLLSATSGIVSSSRRLQLWGDVPVDLRPALFMAERGDDYKRQSEAVPEVVTINVDVYIYINAKDPNIIGATLLNNILDAIDTAIAPSHFTGLQTLGGLVSHCWIEGKIFKDPGDLDGDGVAIIPIKILLPKG